MAYPTATPSVRHTVYFTSAQTGAPFSCTTYWEPSSVYPDTAALQADHDPISATIQTVMAGLCPDAIFIGPCRSVYTNGIDELEVWNVATPQISGTAETALVLPAARLVLPDQDAVIIRRLTGQKGRQHRGRIFIPCIAETFNNEGFLNPAGRTAAKDVAETIGADVVGGTGSWHARHWNRKDNLLEVVTKCTAMIELKSRRDRAPKVPNFAA